MVFFEHTHSHTKLGKKVCIYIFVGTCYITTSVSSNKTLYRSINQTWISSQHTRKQDQANISPQIEKIYSLSSVYKLPWRRSQREGTVMHNEEPGNMDKHSIFCRCGFTTNSNQGVPPIYNACDHHKKNRYGMVFWYFHCTLA